MPEPDRIQDFLRRLTPLSRNNLLTELERLEACGSALPGCATVVEKLRTEFRKDGQPHRLDNPVRYFFAPLEPLLVDGAPEHANSGRILRGSLSPIWEWISRNLLPTMARDYVNEMNRLIATDNQREAGRVVSTFQTKVVKSLEGTLNVPDSAALARTKLAIYTASHAAYDDVTKMLSVLRARDALAKLGDALPAKIGKFDDAQVTKISALLDGVRKTNAETVPFALALVATRLKTPWQLIRLATKVAPSKNVADVAVMPYAVVVSMVLDRLEDSGSALRIALKNNRVLVAKEMRSGGGGGEPVSRQCRPRFGIAQPAQPSIPGRTPDPFGLEGTRCRERRSGLLEEVDQRLRTLAPFELEILPCYTYRGSACFACERGPPSFHGLNS